MTDNFKIAEECGGIVTPVGLLMICREDLNKLVARVRGVLEWQPIETAPKDEQLLLAVEFDAPGDWRIKTGYFCSEMDQWRVWGASWEPTRWMPLPAAPGAAPCPPVSDQSAEIDPIGALPKAPDAARTELGQLLMAMAVIREMTGTNQSDANATIEAVRALKQDRGDQSAEIERLKEQLVKEEWRAAEFALDLINIAKERDGLREALEAAQEFVDYCWRDVSLNDYAEEQRSKAEDIINAALAALPKAEPQGENIGEVFTVSQDEWQVRIGTEVLPTVWNSKGAALAGMMVEMRRKGQSQK